MSLRKYVIFSDVHGRRDLVRALEARHHDAEAFFFLGDGLSDLPTMSVPTVSVRGNCDFTRDPSTPESCLLDLGGVRVLLMHGHRYGVKSGLHQALAAASARGADALLFGHTHRQTEQYFPEGSELSDGVLLTRPLWAFNPGSLAEGSYGLLQIRGGQMLFSHGTL